MYNRIYVFVCFKKNFLQVNTIGLIPPIGYRRADNHSQKSIEWLLYCEREIGREIKYAGRAREFRLLEGEHVDGYLPNVREPAITAKGVVLNSKAAMCMTVHAVSPIIGTVVKINMVKYTHRRTRIHWQRSRE